MRSKLLLSIACGLGLPIIGVVTWSIVATGLRSGSHSDAAHARSAQPLSHGAVGEQYGKLPLAFEPNVGQTDAQVKFLARGSGYTLFLTDRTAVFAFRSARDPRLRLHSHANSAHAADPARPDAAIRLALTGTEADARLTGVDTLPGVSNYAIGSDPGAWRSNVPHFAKVRSHDVYPGIDIEYYGNQRQVEHDFIVAPGADPGRIAFDVDGADHVEIDSEGRLVMGIGADAMRLEKPFAYQDIGGVRREITSGYALQGDHTVRLQVAAYDHARTLVIDPIVVYAANVGGTGVDFGVGIAVDSSGNAYLAGATGSTDFPTTLGAPQTTFAGGSGILIDPPPTPIDGFVAKLNAAGTALLYATYLGGSGDDVAFSIVVDDVGNAYVGGFTNSLNGTTNNFPTTVGAYQTTYGGGLTDGFVTKLDSVGHLSFSTYLGGACIELFGGIAIDGAKNVYTGGQAQVTNPTCTQNFPVTAGAFDTTPDPSDGDVIVAKLNATGSALLYATYLGGVVGVRHEEDGGGMAVDAAGNIYITGNTSSVDFPTTPGAYQTIFGGGVCGGEPCHDAFVSKINPGGNGPADLVYSTFIGRTGWDEGGGIAVDGSGNAYVTGRGGFNFPTTAGVFQPVSNGNDDVFIAKLNPTGTGLVYSTLLGGTGFEIGSGIALDASLNVYVAGETNSLNFPTTVDALSQLFNGSGSSGFICDVEQNGSTTGCDGFVVKLNTTGSGLIYSSYIGGPGDDVENGVAVLGGNVFLSGATSSSFLAAPNSGASPLHGPTDATVIKLTLPSAFFVDDPARVGQTIVKALHITELRTRINALRLAHGLGAYVYTNPTLTPGSTIVQAVDITDMRTALSQAYTAAGLTPPEFVTDPVLTAGIPIKAAHINQLRRNIVNLEGGGGLSVYDGTYFTQACLAVGSACDSGPFLAGRDTITNGAEPHQPNTIGNSCADGTSGTFHVNASNDRLRVSTLDGSAFAPGKTVRIEAFVWSAGSVNSLDLYFTANAASPSWTFISTTVADAAGGPQTMSATYVLPAGGAQAVRARFRSGGSQTPCTGSTVGFDDHDDLVFAVGP